MIITLITGEKVTVKETWEIKYVDDGSSILFTTLTKQTPNNYTVKNGELTQEYKESIIRVNVNHIVSYEETNT